MAFETILAQQPRGPATNQTTPGRQLAAGTGGQVSFRMPMAAADIADPTNSVTFEFQVSNDNATWRTWIGPQAWVGGPGNVDRLGNPAPPNAAGSLGPGTWFVRLLYSIGKRVSIGLDMEVIEN